MNRAFTIACNNDPVSLAAAEVFINEANIAFPGIRLTISTRSADSLATPGSSADFQLIPATGSSLAPVFSSSRVAVIARGLQQYIAIFNNGIIEQLRSSGSLKLALTAGAPTAAIIDFLQKGLPQLPGAFITLETIAEDEDDLVSLRKLNNGTCDGIIVAAAALNLLLGSANNALAAGALLNDKKKMLLPLFDCPAPAGSGAIIIGVEAGNPAAAAVLEKLRKAELTKEVLREYEIATNYRATGASDLAVCQVNNGAVSFAFAAGTTANGESFSDWIFGAPAIDSGPMFASTDYMKDFFNYEFLTDVQLDSEAGVAFISSQKAVHSPALIDQLSRKNTWAAGTKTWFDLSRKGVWVAGSSDGIGFEFLDTVFSSQLFRIEKKDVQMITNDSSTVHWIAEGWKAVATYRLVPSLTADLMEALRHASVIFWTSFQQYKLAKPFLQAKVQHLCPAGKTARLLKAEGLDPFVFPTIKAFTAWRKKHTISTGAE